MDLALSGIRIIDLSQGIAGGFCTKLLAGYGADVIKVEPPVAGDHVRRYGPFAHGTPDPETGALHLYLNTNKRSVTLDTATPTGQSLLRRLLLLADALVDDRPPGALAAEGLDEPARQQINPRLVTTLISAFGQSGPDATTPATNLTASAMGGQMALMGDADREPLKSGGYQAAYQAGLNGFTATLAGLWAAGESDEGDEIDISAMECMASTLEISLNTYLYLKRDLWSGRRGNVMSAAIGLYPCADGYIGVHAMPRNWPALLRLAEMEWMQEDPSFRDAAARLQHEDELRAHFYAWAADKEKKQVYARAGETRAPVAFVHDMADLLESSQLQARGYFQTIDHPRAGPLTYPSGPFRMSDSDWRWQPAPLLGEHNAAVYTGLLGLREADLTVLRGEGII